MPSIVDELTEHVLSWQSREMISDVRIGLGYTALKLSSGRCGLACVLRHRLDSEGCSLLSRAGTITESKPAAIVPLLASPHPLEASLALASINALAISQLALSSSFKSKDIFELLQLNKDDRIGIVGYIAPVVREAQKFAGKVFVFDDAKNGMLGITPLQRQREILPSCDVCILSSTSLLNHSLDELLSLSANARDICLIGPSTPLIPDFFCTKGVTILAGRIVTNPERALRIVSEAGGTQQFKTVTQKVTLSFRSGH